LANLDIKTQLLVLRDLRDMANSLRYPIAVLLSSQHLHEIESVSDKILFLKNGEVTFFGSLDEIGRERQLNTFEFNGPFTLAELREKLADFPHRELYYNGMSFVVKTELSTDQATFLQYLLDKEIPFSYFRDVSQSVKQLFDL